MSESLSVRDLLTGVVNNTAPPSITSGIVENTSGQATVTDERLEPFIEGRYFRVCNPSLPTEDLRNGVLGRGGFGEVVHARRIVDGRSYDFAIKKIDMARVANKDIERQKRELELATCGKIESPYLVRMEQVVADDKYYYIVMELVKGGHDLLKELLAEPLFEPNQRAHRFKPEKAHGIFCKLVMGVMALHRNGVVHRDLKMKNVLYETATGRPLICDFGLTNYYVEGDRLFSDVGTIDFADPCVVTAPLGRSGYSAPLADIWSLGCILHIMLTGYLPYPEGGCLFNDRGVFRLKKPNFSIEGHEARVILLRVPAALHLVSRMLDPNPSLRISLNEILENPWFRAGFDATELSRIPNPPAVAAVFAKSFPNPDATDAERSGNADARALPQQLQSGAAPPGLALSREAHQAQVDKAIEQHVVAPNSAKAVKLLFHGPVGQCKNVLFGAQGIMDKFENEVRDPSMRLMRNRMMTWEKVDAFVPGSPLLLVLETEAVVGREADQAVINVRKAAGANEIFAKVLMRMIVHFKGWVQVHPDSLVDAVPTSPVVASESEVTSASTQKTSSE